MLRALFLPMLAASLFAQNPEFDQALQDTGNRAGLWEAVLDETQSQIFAPEKIHAVFLDISLRVTKYPEPYYLRTDIFLQQNDGSIDRVLLLVDHPVLDANHLSLDARWYSLGPQEHLKVEAGFASDRGSIIGAIAWHARTIQLEFTRPASSGSGYEGEWSTGESNHPGVFHIRNLGDGRVIAVFDLLGLQPSFGGVFVGEVRDGELRLCLNGPTTQPHEFYATLDSNAKLMKGQWGGSGFLSDPDFRRIETTWYIPENTTDAKLGKWLPDHRPAMPDRRSPLY